MVNNPLIRPYYFLRGLALGFFFTRRFPLNMAPEKKKRAFPGSREFFPELGVFVVPSFSWGPCH